ncbi:hypothetical protein KP509_06G009700 [Ceratopteris richardii]|nr:hypothetical protein KP509_06G009700 [Ceratopteris richardii]
MYAKCGAIEKANDLFNQLPRRNIVTWNALIAGFVEHGLCQEALTCLEHMYSEGLSPNAITFISILKACGTLGASEKGKEIHGELDKQGLLEKDIALDNALVDMYAKCGQMNKAFTVLEKLPRRDVVTWNSLIAGYTNHGLYDEALTSFKKMQDDGISPDTITFICLLKACSSIRAADKGEELCAEIDRQGLLGKNMVLGTALIDMYANCGMVPQAQEIFDIFAARDVAMWTALISGYANQGRDDDALNCFERMQEDGFSPDALTFSCILKACGSLGAITKGSQIHEEIQRQGLLAGDAMLGTALVHMYVKSGNLTKAQKVFDDLPMRPVSLWTVLIAGYAEFGHVETVFALFMKMRREGLEPDVILFVVLLTACSHSGLLEEAQLWFQNMSCIFGIAPTVEHYACIIDAFSRAGHFHKALSIISRVSDSHGLKLCSTLLGSCREQSSVELGLWAFGNAVYHDKSCAGTYVSMSNIHAVC